MECYHVVVGIASLAVSWLALPVLVYIVPFENIEAWLSSLFMVVVLVTYRHHDNLRRLWKGQENSLPLPLSREKAGRS